MSTRRPRPGSVAVLAATLALTSCVGGEDPDLAMSSAPTVATTETPDGSEATDADPSTSEPDPDGGPVALAEVAAGFDAPVQALPAPAGDGLLVVEQSGRILLLRDDDVTTFLDIADRVASGGERGLLGVALDEERDRVFVHYSDINGRTTLAVLDHDGRRADPATESVLLTVDQPAANHIGGGLAFGPDGMLYLGLGDGGAGDDRFGNGQRPDTLLGTILRLDVSGAQGYEVPADNPFATGGGAPEVWAFGLRNPWRFGWSEDVLYIADVGQNAVEEVDAVPADRAGINYGWPLKEGDDCFSVDPCDDPGLTDPVVTYRHSETDGCAVIGGVVHADPALPRLLGTYLYGDTCAGLLRGVRFDPDGRVTEVDLTDETGGIGGVLGFGVDRDGGTLVCLADGRVMRLVPAG